jgi:dihydroxyacetone kinase-like predicted kinase
VLHNLDAAALLQWRARSVEALAAARPEIDALNVFSDTGSNLHNTLSTPISPADAAGTLGTVARAISDATLRGARGSSGLILSQLLRGLADGFAVVDGDCRGRALAAALTRAVEAAYVAVSRPVEGTMLTVGREAARAAVVADSDDLVAVVAAAVDAAKEALRGTPDQLDVLADAGVVDAGGRGLVVLLEVLAAVVGEQPMPSFEATAVSPRRRRAVLALPAAQEVMYLLQVDDHLVPGLRTALDLVGEAVVVSGGAGRWNVHVHSVDPPAAIAAGRAVGVIDSISVGSLAAAPVLVMAMPADRTAAATRAVIAAAGGLVTDPAVAGWADVDPATSVAIALGPDAVLTATSWSPDLHVVEVDSVVQALAALAVHDSHRPAADDAVAMTAAAVATRHVEVDEPVAAQQLAGLLTATSEIVTVVAASDAMMRELVSAVRVDRPGLAIDILVAPELGGVVLIGVE